MSEEKEVCVCGHPKEEHTGMSGSDRYCKHLWPTAPCPCENYRAVLPWPDAEGWWWCDVLNCALRFNGHQLELPGAHWHQSYFDHNLGPARFTRLLEPNPFTKETP